MLHLIDHEIVLLDASEIRWSRINTSVGCLHRRMSRESETNVLNCFARTRNSRPAATETLADLKKKWKGLKDTYRKEFKKNPIPRSGAAGIETEVKWKYFKLLLFLQDEVVCTVGDGNFDNCDSPTQDCDGGELTSGTSQFHSTSELQQGDIEQDLSYFQLPNDLGTLHSPMVPITLPNTSKPTNATNIQAESVNASPALSSTYPSPTPSTSSASTRVAKRQTLMN
ncbi:hypothetical protein EVAR_28537_1 [Eumeta japonica]|uniref:MADF domain-containing protein n=1 Tax=Eumeta variegata TaxID=151549 RepID=A0A4C1UWT0_EUMVA|nr:hypothetical protein EVAR_28537_1 [Eumeta japonica]